MKRRMTIIAMLLGCFIGLAAIAPAFDQDDESEFADLIWQVKGYPRAPTFLERWQDRLQRAFRWGS